MDVLYKLEKATVADVLGELPDKRNYSTVRAQLRVLDQKGMVQHEAENMQYVYAPTVPREIARRSMRQEMARLTLARKIATIVLDRVEERSELRRPTSETTNSLSVSERFRSISGDFSGSGRGVLETLWFESESQPVS